MASRIIAALAVFLSACGGGGSMSPVTPQAAACSPVVVTIDLFGDSTMAGYDGGTQALAVHTPTVVLQAALDARFGRGATLVVNRGVSGSDAAQLLAGTDGLNQPWPLSVAAQIVVVNHGINDRAGLVPAYRDELAAMAANAAGARVVFETPNTVLVRDVSPYAEAMRDVAASLGAPLADTNAFTHAATMVDLPDGIHPSDAYYQTIVAGSLAPAVMPLVAALRCE